MSDITHSDWYKLLIDDCRGIITEAVFTSRWTLIEGYHALGQRILADHDNFKREKIYGKEIVQHVAESLNKSNRTIQYSLQFVKKYPEIDKLPDGKNISWHKICNNLLPETTVKEKELDELETQHECPKCGYKW